jgi:Protein of unknown function (DUF3604)
MSAIARFACPLPRRCIRSAHFRGESIALSFALALSLGACDASTPASRPTITAGHENSESPTAASDSETATEAEAESRTPPPDWLKDHPVVSPNAKIETHSLLIEDRNRIEHPADGGGRMWIERIVGVDDMSGHEIWTADSASKGLPKLPAASSHRFELVYEVGEHGIDEDGQLFFEPEPFWDWSPSQTYLEEAPGFTTAVPRGEGVSLEPDGSIAAFQVKGRALEPGEKIDVVYGAGPTGSRVDRYAQRDAEILAGVDANNDGFRAWSRQTPRIDIAAHDATRIVAYGPAEVSPGEHFEIVIAAVDALGNHAVWPARESKFEITLDAASTTGLPTFSPRTAFVSGGDASLRVEFDAPVESGTLRFEVRGLGGSEEFASKLDPIVVREAENELFWADLHGHSGLSDGTGTPEDYFAYARDVARLDAVALTDHDHWGIRPLDESPQNAEQIRSSAARFHDPGQFVTIPGYEWTSWLHGHRHVLYFDESSHEAPIHSSIDPATDSPDELWSALAGQPALTFAHHSAGEPIATNWFFRPDPVLEPVTEIASIHGMSEAADAPYPVDGAIPGYFVRDTLMRGDRLGFIGSGDSHDGHPGLAQLATGSGPGGLAGIFAKTLDRTGLLEALRERRTFATNGIRVWLEVRIDQTFMGGTLPEISPERENLRLQVRFEGSAPIERIDLVRTGAVARLPGDLGLSLDFERSIPMLGPGEFHYVRILQSDGGVAWSSPIFAKMALESSTPE